jgi:hypothetical protein
MIGETRKKMIKEGMKNEKTEEGALERVSHCLELWRRSLMIEMG